MASPFQIIEALRRHLAGEFPAMAVEYFPEAPDNYRLNHPGGALLLSYVSSSFGKSEDTDLAVQEQTITLSVTTVKAQLNGKDGAMEISHRVGQSLLGVCPPDCNRIWLKSEKYLNQIGGIWQYGLDFDMETMRFHDAVAEDAPLLKKLTLVSDYDTFVIEKLDDGSIKSTLTETK